MHPFAFVVVSGCRKGPFNLSQDKKMAPPLPPAPALHCLPSTPQGPKGVLTVVPRRPVCWSCYPRPGHSHCVPRVCCLRVRNGLPWGCTSTSPQPGVASSQPAVPVLLPCRPKWNLTMYYPIGQLRTQGLWQLGKTQHGVPFSGLCIYLCNYFVLSSALSSIVRILKLFLCLSEMLGPSFA